MINKIFFSVFQKGMSDTENLKATESILSLLDNAGIEAVLCYGQYMGTKELSFMVDSKHYNAAREIAIKYGQESILVTDSYGNAVLKYMPVSLESDLPIGKMVEITEDESKDTSSWTRIKGTYYTCREV